jgi:DNA topoisomerase-3
MQALESKIDGLMGKVKTGEVPESLRHLPKVERPALKRRKGGGAKKSYAKTGSYAKKGTSAKKGTKS